MSKYVIEHDELFECKMAVMSAMRVLKNESFAAAKDNDSVFFDSLVEKRDKLNALLEKLYSLEYAA